MLQRYFEAGILIEADIETKLKTLDLNSEDLIEFVKDKNEFMITSELLGEFMSHPPKHNIEEKKEIKEEKKVEVLKTHYKPVAKDYSPKIKLFEDTDVSGKSTCKGKVDDFVSLFRDRFKRTSGILHSHPTNNVIANYTGVKKGDKARFIGMVRSKTVTKNGHLIIEAEDFEGVLKIFISKNNKELLDKARLIINDEVLAFDGKYGDPFFYVDNFIWPDVPVNNVKKTIEEDLSIAFLSDTHVGSKLFMKKNFENFISWIKGNGSNEREREIASKVKYLLIAGDLVDGIGIYPGQEKELEIQDVYKQYDTLMGYLEQVPEYINIVMIPGNHDAVRRADPQPKLDKSLIKKDYSNVILGSSPSMFKIEQFNVLMYHGNSMDSMIANIPGLSYHNPEYVIVEYLRRRHLGPIFGANHLIPEEKDYLVIDNVPNIVHIGHVHKNGYLDYHNVSLINSGTWQSQTDYQRMQGHIPTPCLLPIYDMHKGNLNVVDFNER